MPIKIQFNPIFPINMSDTESKTQESQTKINLQLDPKTLKDKTDLFLNLIQISSVAYDYSSKSKDIKAKADRLTALHDLNEFLKDPQSVSTYVPPHLDLVFKMIKKNIFRPLPMLYNSADEIGPLEPGEVFSDIIDPAWPYLQGVYEFFLELITCQTPKIKRLKVFITRTFMQEFIQLFDSEETKERDYLKKILTILYVRLIRRRKMIRKVINDELLTIIHDTQKFNGINDILEFLESVINGFHVPLRDEHVAFFKNILIPLHKVHTINTFHCQLERCSMYFLHKDKTLSIPLIDGLLRYWSIVSYSGEMSFLYELLHVLEFCEISKLEPLIPKLFNRLIRCISSPHYYISDVAMQFFDNDHFLSIFRAYKQIAFPITLPVIIDLSESKSHKIIIEVSNYTKMIFKEIDPEAYEKVLQNREGSVKINSSYDMYTKS